MNKIAIIGAGGIGTTFAVQLARAGHDVTLVARGKRLAQLQQHAGVPTKAGLVPLQVAAVLDPALPFDLVLVTVLAHQVDALLPQLAASPARRVMFMFNTFAKLEPLRAAVGAERFSFGFPAILAHVDAEGTLHSDIKTRGLLTTVTDASLAETFSAAGIPSVVCSEMESWLRSHVAAVVPVMVAAGVAYSRGAGISWAEAGRLATAMHEGFALVRSLGNELTPAPVAVLGKLPHAANAALLWLATRNRDIRQSGAVGSGEARALIDAMRATSAHALPALEQVRPA